MSERSSIWLVYSLIESARYALGRIIVLHAEGGLVFPEDLDQLAAQLERISDLYADAASLPEKVDTSP